MIRRVLDYLRPPPVADVAALCRFLSGEASYLAQRATYEFTRNTLAWYGQAAFGDARFNQQFGLCRWETFAALLAGNVLLAEGELRPHAAGRERTLAERLGEAFAAMLAEYPLPDHRGDWSDSRAAIEARLSAAAAAPPPDPAALARQAAGRVFDTLPVRSANPEDDRRTFESALRFGMVSFNDQLRLRLRPVPVVAQLLAGS
jgi:hypothetical protein